MNQKRMERIMREGIFDHPFVNRKLVETHISFVILGRHFAYKFKKEIRYSFVDFSTLALRKYYCEREVELNNRLSSGMYLGVIPVREYPGGIQVGGTTGKIVDYAVKMKRLPDACQMHVMLDRHQVTRQHIKAIALTLRDFHQRTDVIATPFQPSHFVERFNDILSIRDIVKATFGIVRAGVLDRAVKMSDVFLKKHRDLLIQRISQGYIRDCHGDLHSRNIFLCPKPVIFDCLEFNDELRQIDILDEIAFFCMDLEAEGYHQLSEAFTTSYFSGSGIPFGTKERLLFTYYKCYRANVRAKVYGLQARNEKNQSARKKSLYELDIYLNLIETYLKNDLR